MSTHNKYFHRVELLTRTICCLQVETLWQFLEEKDVRRDCEKLSNSRLASPLEVKFSSRLFGTSVLRAFHKHPSVISV